MSGDNLTRIGPVAIDLGEPKFQWTSKPMDQGARGFQISGDATHPISQQLSELVANPHRRPTIAGFTGVLEYVHTDHDLFRPYAGWAVLQSCQVDDDVVSELSGFVPVSVQAVRLPDAVQLALTRSARARANDYGLAAAPLVAAPFHDADPDGSPFTVNPGGSRFARDYDASHPHSTARLIPDVDDARAMTLYANPTESIARPALANATGVPDWVIKRGGDCRGYNRREMREVYGPSHRFAVSTDCLIVNGLIRAQLGSRGLPAHLHVQAFADGSWHDVGVVRFDDTAVLLGHRLTKVTPDVVILALTLQGTGDVFVTLKRGERQLRIDGAPVTWSGLPPTSWGSSARVDTGKFGNALVGGADVEDNTWAAPFRTWAGDDDHAWDGSPYQPDVRLRWPADLAPSAWARTRWFRPDRAVADLGTVGLLSLYDSDGVAHVEWYVDAADHKAKVRVLDTVVLQTTALDFAASDDLFIGLRYDGTTLTMSWRTAAGVPSHTSAPVTITADAFYDEASWVNFDRLGGVPLGSVPLGGTTHYPGGHIDNDMTFEDALTDAEFVALGAASHALDALPNPEARMRRWLSYDPSPFPSMSTFTSGLSIDSETDADGFTKAIAVLDAERLTVGALLARTDIYDTPAAQHAQLAAESEQSTRVR